MDDNHELCSSSLEIEQVYESHSGDESNCPRERADSNTSTSAFEDPFHDSGFNSDFYSRQSSSKYGNYNCNFTDSDASIEHLQKIVKKKARNMDPETAKLFSVVFAAVEKASQERNVFEEKLRQRQLSNLDELSEISQEIDHQIEKERERLDREFKEKQQQMRELVQSEMSDLQTRLTCLESENSTLKHTLHSIDAEKNHLKEEYDYLKRDNELLVQSLSSTKDQLNFTKEYARSVKYEQLDQIMHREKSLETLATESEKERVMLLEKIAELEEEKNRLKEQNAELEMLKAGMLGDNTDATDGGETIDNDCHRTFNANTLFLPTNSRLGEDELWSLDPKNNRRDFCSSNEEDSCTISRSTLSLVSLNEINDVVNEHMREAESTTSLYSPPSTEKVFKIVFLGDVSVGKTSFIQRFHSNLFSRNVSSTIGIDFLLKNLVVHHQYCTLQLWDTCGQEKFRALTRHYFRKADGVILMYDVTRPDTFYSLKNWMDDVAGYAPSDCCLMIVGNKADLAPVELDTEMVKATIGSKSDFSFTEVSSRSGQNVEQCMSQFTSRLIHRDEERALYPERQSKQLINIRDDNFFTKRKKCCPLSK